MNNFKFGIIFIICIAEVLNTSPKGSYIQLNQAASSKTLQMRDNNKWGNYLTDSRGMALYMFSKDHTGSGFSSSDFKPSCYGSCANLWPPLTAQSSNSGFTAGSGINQNMIGTTKRNNGMYQLTYNNIPLYYYKLDKLPGDVKGQLKHGHGGVWYLITPKGNPIMNS